MIRPGVFCQSYMSGFVVANLIIFAGLKSTGNTKLEIIEKEQRAMKTVTSGQPGDFKGHWMAPTCDISKAVLHIASNWVPYPFWKPRLLFLF